MQRYVTNWTTFYSLFFNKSGLDVCYALLFQRMTYLIWANPQLVQTATSTEGDRLKEHMEHPVVILEDFNCFSVQVPRLPDAENSPRNSHLQGGQ